MEEGEGGGRGEGKGEEAEEEAEAIWPPASSSASSLNLPSPSNPGYCYASSFLCGAAQRPPTLATASIQGVGVLLSMTVRMPCQQQLGLIGQGSKASCPKKVCTASPQQLFIPLAEVWYAAKFRISSGLCTQCWQSLI